MKRLTRDEMIKQVKMVINRKTLHLRFDSSTSSVDASYWLSHFSDKLNVYVEMCLITVSTYKRYKRLIERLFFCENVNLNKVN